MGCYSYTCSVSGLPIEHRDKVVYLALTRGEGTRDVGINHAWMPATLPLMARYNDYGSIEDWDAARGAVFFESLARRAIERPVGENRVHDIAITRDLEPKEWLFALLEGRVQIKHRSFGVTELVQAMVRKEVWSFLVRTISKRLQRATPGELRTGLAMATHLDRTDREHEDSEKARFELVCAIHALGCLGRPWARGSAAGPQFPAWHLQQRFAALQVKVIGKYLKDLPSRV